MLICITRLDIYIERIEKDARCNYVVKVTMAKIVSTISTSASANHVSMVSVPMVPVTSSANAKPVGRDSIAIRKRMSVTLIHVTMAAFART